MLSILSFRPARLAPTLGLTLALIAAPILAQDIAVVPADAGIAVIEAPDGAGTELPEGAFALAPERQAPVDGTAMGHGRGGLIGSPPVVIELFTSQGCSSCPAADALVAALADQPGVLTLSWHVDYWDYLGWSDVFARPEHTARQEAYAAVAGERGVYTPQIIVDGHDTLLTLHRSALMALIGEHAARPPVIMVTAAAAEGAHVIDLTPRAAIPGGVEVALVRYLPHRTVRIRAGENRDRTVGYSNIVVGIERLTLWSARAPLRLTVRAGDDPDNTYPDDTRHAILVQQSVEGGRPGPILAAVQLD